MYELKATQNPNANTTRCLLGLKREPKNKELAKTRQKVQQEITAAAKKSNLVDQKCDSRVVLCAGLAFTDISSLSPAQAVQGGARLVPRTADSGGGAAGPDSRGICHCSVTRASRSPLSHTMQPRAPRK